DESLWVEILLNAAKQRHGSETLQPQLLEKQRRRRGRCTSTLACLMGGFSGGDGEEKLKGRGGKRKDAGGDKQEENYV
ncbi:hypothetical protein NQZ68_009912, partial [Dissostichus eleginoides]